MSVDLARLNTLQGHAFGRSLAENPPTGEAAHIGIKNTLASGQIIIEQVNVTVKSAALVRMGVTADDPELETAIDEQAENKLGGEAAENNLLYRFSKGTSFQIKTIMRIDLKAGEPFIVDFTSPIILPPGEAFDVTSDVDVELIASFQVLVLP